METELTDKYPETGNTHSQTRNKGRLTRKLLVWFLLVALVPMSITSFIAYYTAKNSLYSSALESLDAYITERSAFIDNWFKYRFIDLESQATSISNVRFLGELHDAFKSSGMNLRQFVESDRWNLIVDKQSEDLKTFRKLYEYNDVFLIDKEGNILFNFAGKSDLGINLFNGPLAETRFADTCRLTLKTGHSSFSDLEHYQPANNVIAGFFTSVIVNQDGEKIGIFALRISPEQIKYAMRTKRGLNSSIQTYIIGYSPEQKSVTLRSLTLQTGHAEDTTQSYKPRPDGNQSYLNRIVDTEITRLWMEEHGLYGTRENNMKEHGFIYNDFSGKPVLGIHNNVTFATVNWGIIAEIPVEQAFAPADYLKNQVIVLVLVTCIFVIIIATIITRHIVHPIVLLSAAAKRVTMGNLAQKIEINATDEIGDLAGSFNTMVETISRNRKENTLKEWFQTGQMDLNNVMRGNNDLSGLCRNIITFLAKYLTAEIGAIYISDNDRCLKLTGSYAFFASENSINEFDFGQGVVGQAALERKRIVLTRVPNDYISVQSGLGRTTPHSLVIKPFMRENTVFGVIELAALEPFSEKALEFLDVVSENIAVGIQTILAHIQVRDLLEQSRSQTGKLKVSEEKLRQANENLREHTQALKKSELELQNQQSELKQSNEELEEKTERLVEQKEDIESKNIELERVRNIIEDKARALELSNKYKSEFLANMSHELRTPLNSILLLSNLFVNNKDGDLNEDQIESAEAINSSGKDLLRLINEILDLSKIEAGKMEINPETVNIKQFATTILHNFKHHAKKKGLKSVIELTDDLPQQINTDLQRLEQIIRNFFSNALKFTSKGQIALKISFSAQEIYRDLFSITTDIPEKMIAFSVIDTGIGIPVEKQKLIFEAFQQADGSTSRQFGGTGLGLSISRELAKKLGGVIKLESQEGEGSSFTLYLPTRLSPSDQTKDQRQTGIELKTTEHQKEHKVISVSPEKEKARTSKSALTPIVINDDRKIISSEDRSILIIEDDQIFAKILRDMSREYGFKCLIAHDGETGLQLCDSYKPDAIILDIGLPGINGWKVMARLKENSATRHIPVHFISAEDREKEATNTGAIDFLTKPVTPVMLERAFDNINRIISKEIKDLLVIEDNEQQVKAIRALIGNNDVKITSVDNAENAYNEIKKGKYDCVILDLKLPDMSGIQLLSKINDLDSSVRLPIIVYTGKELTAEEINIINQYADTIIKKGITSQQQLLDGTNLFLHRIEENLPVQQQKQIRMLHDKEAVLKGKTILVVDDDMRNVFAVKKVLEDNKMNVVVGKNGREGIEKLHQHKTIDLILMDIMMPEMNGYEAMGIIKKDKQYKKLPIIALTAKAMKGDKAECIEAGANDYLAKPLDIDQMLSMLKVWLNR